LQCVKLSCRSPSRVCSSRRASGLQWRYEQCGRRMQTLFEFSLILPALLRVRRRQRGGLFC